MPDPRAAVQCHTLLSFCKSLLFAFVTEKQGQDPLPSSLEKNVQLGRSLVSESSKLVRVDQSQKPSPSFQKPISNTTRAHNRRNLSSAKGRLASIFAVAWIKTVVYAEVSTAAVVGASARLLASPCLPPYSIQSQSSCGLWSFL